MSLLLVAENRWDSPYVFSSWVALCEKGLAFDVREIALDEGEQRGAELSPALTARVPMLCHDGFWLAESGAIAEYLDEAFPDTRRMLPADLRERARARQLMHWLRSDLMALRVERSTETIFYDAPIAPLSAEAVQAAAKLERVTGALLAEAPAQGRLFASFSLVDAELAMMWMRLLHCGDPVPAAIAGYVRAQWARPSVQSFVSHPRR